MKSATFPSLRVDPALRRAAEDVLEKGESLSSFVEQSVRVQIERRKLQDDFVARGLAARGQARRTGIYLSTRDVVQALEKKLAQARKRRK
jgi:predicted transcriptional regulator